MANEKEYINKYYHSHYETLTTYDPYENLDGDEKFINIIIDMQGLDDIQELDEYKNYELSSSKYSEKEKKEILDRWEEFKKFAMRQSLVGLINEGADNGYGYFYIDNKTKKITGLVGSDEAHYAIDIASSLDELVAMFKSHKKLCKVNKAYAKEGGFIDNIVWGVSEGNPGYKEWACIQPREPKPVNSVDIVYGYDPFTGKEINDNSKN